jgi:hypothetical protein
MNNLRQAAQQALEALEAETSESWECNSYHPKIQPAITALRAALAEPDPDYERGFVDGMQEQMKRSVDRAVNAMADAAQEQRRGVLGPVLNTGGQQTARKEHD